MFLIFIIWQVLSVHKTKHVDCTEMHGLFPFAQVSLSSINFFLSVSLFLLPPNIPVPLCVPIPVSTVAFIIVTAINVLTLLLIIACLNSSFRLWPLVV